MPPVPNRAGDHWSCPYDECDGSGIRVDEARLVALDCRCREARQRSVRVSGLRSSIPRKYREVSFDRAPMPSIAATAPAQVRAVRAYIRDLADNLRQGRGLWLYGTVGTGKTTLAMLVSKAAIDAGHSVAIYSLPRLLAEIRTTYDDASGDTYTALLDRLADVDLLHIDDVGTEKTSEWVLEQLYSIINARYEEERTVIITTNLEREDLATQIHERTVSRLEEMCEVLPLYGADARRQQYGRTA
ncbi:DNA replication protein DnaC [Paraconexibacter sp. AEG42_29]|uniref:DNA replication protein DnaC n=1 Tax=Paraconexibacter sp. AEG42_29 TaxID=2997339 RepID=A0AAU7B3I6_9ACTN